MTISLSLSLWLCSRERSLKLSHPKIERVGWRVHSFQRLRMRQMEEARVNVGEEEIVIVNFILC